jgi:hypothetical protein
LSGGFGLFIRKASVLRIGGKRSQERSVRFYTVALVVTNVVVDIEPQRPGTSGHTYSNAVTGWTDAAEIRKRRIRRKKQIGAPRRSLVDRCFGLGGFFIQSSDLGARHVSSLDWNWSDTGSRICPSI